MPASAAALLLQTGLVLAVVAGAHGWVVRHLPHDDVPGVLVGRIARSVRARPWVIASAVVLALCGALLGLD